MPRPGNPWDNALAESFFKIPKRELINGNDFKTKEEDGQAMFKRMEPYCNRQRIHSGIGHSTSPPCGLGREAI